MLFFNSKEGPQSSTKGSAEDHGLVSFGSKVQRKYQQSFMYLYRESIEDADM